jgi:hypothetical protein
MSSLTEEAVKDEADEGEDKDTAEDIADDGWDGSHGLVLVGLLLHTPDKLVIASGNYG